MDRGSGYGPSMVTSIAPADFFEKLIFGLFWLCGVTICFHLVSLNKVVSVAFELSIC